MKKILLLVMLLLIITLSAEKYTVAELLNETVNNNVSLQQSKISLTRVKFRLHNSRINYLPDLSAYFSRSENWDNIMFDNNITNNQIGFSISKTFSLNDQTYYSNKNAGYNYSLAKLSNEDTLRKTLYSFYRSYISVLLMQKQIKLNNENISIQERIVTESQILFKQNKITQFDLQQTEINLLNTKINILRDQIELSKLRNDLFDIVNIEDEGKELDEIDLYSNDEEFSKEIDFESINSVQQDNITAQKHKTDIFRNKLDFFPSMNLSYRYGRSLHSENFDFNRGATSHSLTLNLSYSLNGLFNNNYDRKDLKLISEHNELNTGQLIKDINQRYYQYIDELNLLEQRQLLLESRLNQTEVNFLTAQQRYRLGLQTQLDLDRANNDNQQAKIDLESNNYNIILKKLEIENLLF